MEAKEMFEKLGYSQFIGSKDNYPHEFILYKCFEDNGIDKYIEFCEKSVRCSWCDETYPHVISMEELQAINQQCKELEWIE